MKYIDADLLRKAIEKEKKYIEELFTVGDNSFYDGQDDAYNEIFGLIDSLQQEPIEKDKEIEKLIVCDIMEATVKRVNIDKQDKDKEEEAMLKKINYLRNLGLNECE